MTLDGEPLHQGTPPERRLAELLDVIRDSAPPVAEAFARALARRAGRQLVLRRVLHVLAVVAEAAPRTIATLVGGSRPGGSGEH